MSDVEDATTIVERREDIPKFATEAEEVAYWSTHALADHLFTRRGQRPGSVAERLSMQRFKPHAVFSEEADAAYVYLVWGRVVRSQALGDSRVVDYTGDGSVSGIRFLNVSEGIDLSGLPERDRVVDLLKDLKPNLRVLA